MRPTLVIGLFYAVYLTGWISALVNQSRLKKLFQSHYPEIALEVFSTRSLSGWLHRLHYIAGRQYRELEDTAFVARVDGHRRIELVSFSIVLLGMVAGGFVINILRPAIG